MGWFARVSEASEVMSVMARKKIACLYMDKKGRSRSGKGLRVTVQVI